jgi:hypothetical protein
MTDAQTFISTHIKQTVTDKGYHFKILDSLNYLIETNSEIYFVTLNKTFNDKKTVDKCRKLTRTLNKLVTPFEFFYLKNKNYFVKNLKNGTMTCNFF